MANIDEQLARIELFLDRGISLDAEDEKQLDLALEQLRSSQLTDLAHDEDPWERNPKESAGEFELYHLPAQKRLPNEPWQIQITPEFVKTTESIDRKVQGRILEAIIVISNFPMTRKGDTIKSLSGDLAGLWRYRIGDFRLLYKPNADTLTVCLLTFCSRGHAYD